MESDNDAESEAGYALTEAPPGPSPKVEQHRWSGESFCDTFRTETLGSPGGLDSIRLGREWKETIPNIETPQPLAWRHGSDQASPGRSSLSWGKPVPEGSELEGSQKELITDDEKKESAHRSELQDEQQETDLSADTGTGPAASTHFAKDETATSFDSPGCRGHIRSLRALRKMSAVAESVRETEVRYNERSLFLFRLNNPIRKLAIRAIEWKWWDRTVLFLIALNTIQLAMYDPFDTPHLRPVSARREALDLVGQIFSIVFTAECFVKVVAMGLCIGERTFLTSAWNYLDLFIVIIGLLDFIPSGGGDTGNLSALRSLRVLRPLRAITKFPELRFLVVLLLKSVPMLSNVLGLCCFLFFVFGILGVQLFAGRLRGRCFSLDSGEVGDMCAVDGGYALCPEAWECLMLGSNPERGIIHFDAIGGAIMTIFQVMTMEGWTDVMYMVQDTFHPSMFVYFVLLIFVGPIFAIQLFLVVISTQYALTKKKHDKLAERAQQDAEEDASSRKSASPVVAAKQSRQNSATLLEGRGYRVHPAPLSDSATPRSANGNGNGNGHKPEVESGGEVHKSEAPHSNAKAQPANGEEGGEGGGLAAAPEADLSHTTLAAASPPPHGSIALHGEQPKGSEEAEKSWSANPDSHFLHAPHNQLRPPPTRGASAAQPTHEDSAQLPAVGQDMMRPGSTLDALVKKRGSIVESTGGVGKKTRKFSFKWWRRQLKELAESEALSNFIVGMIVLNTVLMGMDHDCDLCNQGYCARFKAVMEGTNLAFAGIFLAEMLIKIVGLGPLAYASNVMNIFDAVIVVISLLEVEVVYQTSNCLWHTPVPYTAPPCEDFDPCEGGGGGLTVLRTFRLVRIVKLLRTFPDIQKQVKIVISIVGSVAALIALIFIFLLIFCILGMNVFGGQVVDEWDPGSIMLGAEVYVEFPGDTLPSVLRGRHGKVVGLDPFNHSSRPWQVQIDYGTEAQVHVPLAIGEQGRVWVTDFESRVQGDPAIVAVVPRLHYDDLLHSAITTFQILTMANWNDVLYSHVASSGAPSSLFFYSIIVVGNWMLLNLFIAILIQGFADQRNEKMQENKAKIEEGLIHSLGGLDEVAQAEKLDQLWQKMDSDGSGEISKTELRKMLEEMGVTLGAKEMTDLFRKYDEDDSGVLNFHEFLLMIRDILLEAEKKKMVKGIKQSSKNLLSLEETAALKADFRKSSRQLMQSKTLAEEMHNLRQASSADNPAKEPRSLLIFAPDNRFRLLCKAVSEHWLFDKIVLACILTSSVCLAIENPGIGDDSPMRVALNIIDLILNGVFTLECILKVVALNFRKYLKSGWNKLDLVIVTTSALDMIVTYGVQGDIDLAMLKIFRTFRILRALRPLRIIARARGLRVLVSTLMSAVKPVLNTGAIAFGVFAIFGILGMQLLSGKLYSCTDAAMHNWKDCNGIDDDGNVRQWETYPVHFNNILWAIRSMFVLSTQDDWPAHMWAGIDSTSKKTGPVQNSQPGLVIYYVACILIAGYLVINIFVGVFVDCYNSASAELEKPKDPKIKRKDLPKVFDVPKDAWRRGLESRITTNFDLVIAFFIVTNVLTMAFESFQQADWQSDFGLVANFFFTFVFGLECLYKICAYHPRRYLLSGWHKFDYFIVMVSYAGICIDNMGATVNLDPTLLRVLRVFRIFRILRAFRIFKAAKGLQAIIQTLGNSLASLVNLGSMLALVFFIFAVLGVTLFGELCAEGDEQQPGLQAVRCLFTAGDDMLAFHANFKGIGIALLTLFRVATADAWGELLDAAQLGIGPRGLSVPEWDKFTALLGADPGWDREASDTPLRVAATSIQQWYAIAQGREEEIGWPAPDAATQEWIDMARIALPACIEEEEIVELESMGLADCSVGGHSKACVSSCGSTVAANLYFSIFFCLSAFVLLQLVIAVLMEQLATIDNDERDTETIANTTLTLPQFRIMVRRWRWNFKRQTLPREQWRRPPRRQSSVASFFSRTVSSNSAQFARTTSPTELPSLTGRAGNLAAAEETPQAVPAVSRPSRNQVAPLIEGEHTPMTETDQRPATAASEPVATRSECS